MQRHFTYYKCLRVLCRDTFTTYKAAQKHQQEHPGHVCMMKTSTEPRAVTRSRIHIPLVSQPRIRMVRVSTTSTVTLPTSTALQAELQAPPLLQSEPQQHDSSATPPSQSEPQLQLTPPQQQQAQDPMWGAGQGNQMIRPQATV